jgi:steroid Delta-isomerase
MPTREQMVAACDRYVEALTAGDVDTIMDLYADEPTVIDPVGSEPRVGREAVRAFYEKVSSVDLACRRLGPVTVADSHAVFQFLIEVDLGESTVRMVTSDVMRFDEDGKVVEMTAYPDDQADPDERPAAP